jgi:hypothetical protein
MCFEPPSPPKPTAEELAREKEQDQMIANQKAESAATLAEDKKMRTQSSFGRQSGMYGMRSLIAGPKGGAGFY